MGACAVICAWLAGIALWGTPEMGFRSELPILNWAFIVVVGVPAMAVAALADGGTGGRGRALRTGGIAVFVVAVIALMWATSFVHFGGFCMDELDACVVRWPSRIAGLALALGLLGAGWLVAVTIDRWRRSRSAV